MDELNFRLIGTISGMVLIALGLAMVPPALVDIGDHDVDIQAFLLSGMGCMFFGGVLFFSNRGGTLHLKVKDTFFLTSVLWIILSLFSALPYYVSQDIDLSFTDSVFEAVSGVTTTGSTVLSGLDDMSRGLLLWRSLTQWIGGIGIIALAFIFLPFLKIGGMQLFQTESSDQSDKITPKTKDMIFMIVSIYVFLTVLCGFVYLVLGMSAFDALCHALTTLSTGGFSTHDASFGYFGVKLQWAATFFMFCGGVPFILVAQAVFKGKPAMLFRNSQVKAFSMLVAGLIVLLSLWMWKQGLYSFSDSLRIAAFSIVSIITTTGYTVTNYLLWGHFPIMFFFFLTYVGGCTGSTAGGMKIMRLEIVAKTVGVLMKRLLSPHGMFTARYGGKTLGDDVSKSVMVFLSVFVSANVFLIIALGLCGLDLETAFSAAATATANVGPGIGDIGPGGNFSLLPDEAKWLLIGGMFLGRLEFLTVIVLFSTTFWRS